MRLFPLASGFLAAALSAFEVVAEEPQLDLPEVVVEGIDQPERPASARDPARTEPPEVPMSVVRGQRSTADGRPAPSVWTPESPEVDAPAFRISALCAGGNHDWREAGAAARLAQGRRELHAVARGFNSRRHSAIEGQATFGLTPRWSLESRFHRWRRALWGAPVSATDERRSAVASLLFADSNAGRWTRRAALRVGWARVDLRGEMAAGEQSGAFGQLLGEWTGDLSGARALLGSSIAVEPELSVVELWTELARPTDRDLTFRLGLGGLAASIGETYEGAFTLLGAIDAVARPDLVLSVGVSAEVEPLGLEWWSRAPAPISGGSVQPTLRRKVPAVFVSLNGKGSRHLALSFERRLDDVIWVEDAGAEGLLRSGIADSRVATLTGDWELGDGLALGCWGERAWADGGGDLPYRAPWAWRGSATTGAGPLRLEGAVRGASDQAIGEGDELAGWITIDAAVALTLFGELSVAIEAVNLLNERWVVWRGYDEEGTSIRLSLRRSWHETLGRLPRVASWITEDQR